jgi:hypothetical protein
MVHVTIGTGAGNGRAMPALSEDWNQSGSVSVVTYSNCDSVILYVNATKIGTKKSSDFASNMIMQWTGVPWSSGTIKAIGMKGGVQAAIDSINTAGPASKILLKTNKTTLYADGEDVCCIEVDVADANNNFVITAANQIQFTMTGAAGRSLGIASGDWTSSEPFKATTRKAYKGKVLIVIQSTMVPGTINVTVSAAGLTSASLALTTVAQQVGVIRPGASSLSSALNSEGRFSCVQMPGSKNIRVNYLLDAAAHVNLSVVSSSGRMIGCLTNKYHQAGAYTLDWNAINKTGVYFIVLKANNDVVVRKAFVMQ